MAVGKKAAGDGSEDDTSDAEGSQAAAHLEREERREAGDRGALGKAGASG